jgi:hypothetical protein
MDIITCIKSIDNIIKKNIKITNKTVNDLSSILVRFRLEAIPIEYSEKLLSMIGNTMEYDDCDETFLLFVSNPIFVQVISNIIIDFNNKIIPVKKINDDDHHDFIASFTSHYCYELVLYIWLGFIDRTKFLKVLTSTIDMSMIEKIFISISVAIPYDYLYLTQVIIIIIILYIFM